MKKNVLFVMNSGLVRGGVPVVTMDIVRGLSDEFQFDISCGSERGTYDEEFISYGGTIERRHIIPYEHKIGVVLNGFILYHSIKTMCKKKKYHVIHCEDGWEAGPALIAAAHCGVPVRINHAHGVYSKKYGKNLFYNTYKKICLSLMLRYITVRLACSKVAGESLFDEEFENIANPVDIELNKNFVKKEHDGINLLQIGTFCDRKNQIFSIELLKKLKEQKMQTKLYFIGYDDGTGYLKKMNECIHKNGLKNDIVFLPADYPKSKIFAVTDYCLLPSHMEGLPLAAIESQVANIFTIISDKVSKETDMGICSFLSMNSPEKWISCILGYQRKDIKADPEKLKLVQPELYIKKIGKIYNDCH